jgi:hypothetical protein
MASIVPPTIPPVCEGDHICSSSIAVCHVAIHIAACVDAEFSGCIKGRRVMSEFFKHPNLSILRMPVMVDQPDISRALEIKNCATLIAPYGSKAGRVVKSESGDRRRRTASAYCTGAPELLATRRRWAHSPEEDADQ